MIEIMVVMAIIAGVMGMGIMSLSSLKMSQLSGEATHLTGALRLVYGRAAMNGVRYQAKFNVGSGTMTVECSDANVAVKRDDDGDDGKKAERKRKRAEDAEANPFGTAGHQAASFKGCDEKLLDGFELKDDVVVEAVLTTHNREPVTAGEATIAFFPDGFVERSMIWLKGPDGGKFTLLIDPMSGRVRARAGDVEIPRDFFDVEED